MAVASEKPTEEPLRRRSSNGLPNSVNFLITLNSINKKKKTIDIVMIKIIWERKTVPNDRSIGTISSPWAARGSSMPFCSNNRQTLDLNIFENVTIEWSCKIHWRRSTKIRLKKEERKMFSVPPMRWNNWTITIRTNASLKKHKRSTFAYFHIWSNSARSSLEAKWDNKLDICFDRLWKQFNWSL